MGKKVITVIGSVKIKMDVGDDDSGDAKDPHVSLEQDGRVTVNHLYLSEVNDYVGRNSDEKAAIYWIRDHKSELEREYQRNNR